MVESQSRQSTIIESIDPNGNGVRLELDWLTDRFRHRISGLHCRKSIEILTSVEGDQEEEWPLSPPLQEFNDPTIVSDFNQGQARLAIGSAGSAHWAVSVEAVENTGELPAITFDVACRTRHIPKWLGSTYRLSNVKDCSCGLSKVSFLTAAGVFQLRAVEKQHYHDVVETLLHVSDTTATLSCGVPDQVIKPVTLRWRYCFERLL